MGRTCIKDHRPEHSLGNCEWLNGCAQCEIERLRAAVAAERERCAAECRKLAAMWRDQDGNEKRAGVAEGCADAILGA